jgi:hypothetical protein
VLERTNTTERYTRGVAAAVVAVVTLVLAANAGPARPTEHQPPRHTSPATAPDAFAGHQGLSDQP